MMFALPSRASDAGPVAATECSTCHAPAFGKGSADKGNAMWDLALDIGRQTLETLAKEAKSGKAGKSK